MQNNVNRWCKPASHVVDISILGHIQVDIGTIMWIIGVIVEQDFHLSNDNHHCHRCRHTYLVQHLLWLKLLVSLQVNKH